MLLLGPCMVPKVGESAGGVTGDRAGGWATDEREAGLRVSITGKSVLRSEECLGCSGLVAGGCESTGVGDVKKRLRPPVHTTGASGERVFDQRDAVMGLLEAERLVSQGTHHPSGVAMRVRLHGKPVADLVVVLGRTLVAEVVVLPTGEIGELGHGSEGSTPCGLITEAAVEHRGCGVSEVGAHGRQPVSAAESFVCRAEHGSDLSDDFDLFSTDTRRAGSSPHQPRDRIGVVEQRHGHTGGGKCSNGQKGSALDICAAQVGNRLDRIATPCQKLFGSGEAEFGQSDPAPGSAGQRLGNVLADLP